MINPQLTSPSESSSKLATIMDLEQDPYKMNRDWTDCGEYYLNIHPQGTEGWKLARSRHPIDITVRTITASNFASAAGLSPYKTQEEYMLEWTGNIKEVHSPEATARMNKGNELEPFVRKLYERMFGVSVREVGYAIMKSDMRLGASLDGVVGEDGCIEIKCPVKMYTELLARVGTVTTSYEDINSSHYSQMQGGMAVTGRKWCDYCVYCNGYIFVERIPFDRAYWYGKLYPKLLDFLLKGSERINVSK